MHGRGLNSIRWRFALAGGVLTFAALAMHRWLAAAPDASPGRLTALDLALAVSAAAIFFALAGRLTAMIARLKESVEAIAAGDAAQPVELECQCEVGGLAQSFRKMTTRLNANLLRINALAYSDPITALPNRAVIQHLLDYALAPGRAGEFRAAIVFIDLDGFKRINDTLGHEGGDELLRLAADRILRRGLQRTPETLDTCTDAFGNPCERLPTDILFGRFAGDEFVAILPGATDRAALARVGEAIIASLAEPFRLRGHELSVGASIGIAITPDDTSSATELLQFADLAMYSSKQAGKARCMFFDKRVREQLVERTRIEAELRGALQRDELVLHFQPKVDTATLAPTGVEALVRWRHPQRGLLPPGAFIDVAEQAGLMARLGERIMVLAIMQCRAWLDAGLRRPVAVNVSPAQFTEQGFVDGVLAALRTHGVPPELISIEITESMAMKEFDATAQRLAVLREAGVEVAIDDFGIGFSNLSQLARLPVDQLKVDRSLIVEIGRSARSESIIRAILGMAHALGYTTIAEGIETPEQLRFLADLGCHRVQGFLFGRPMTPEALEQWVAERERVPAAA